MLYSERGEVRSEAEDYDAALMDFNRALALDPLAIDPLLARGFMFGKQGLYAFALQDFDEVITRAPDVGEAYLGRGLARAATGDDHGADADFMQAYALGIESERLDAYLREMGVIE